MFGREAERILRTNWTDVNAFAQELFALFRGATPLYIDRPVIFRQKTLTGDPPLTIEANPDPDAPVIRVNRAVPGTPARVETAAEIKVGGDQTGGRGYGGRGSAPPPGDSTTPGLTGRPGEDATPGTDGGYTGPTDTREGGPADVPEIDLTDLTVTVTIPDPADLGNTGAEGVDVDFTAPARMPFTTVCQVTDDSPLTVGLYLLPTGGGQLPYAVVPATALGLDGADTLPVGAWFNATVVYDAAGEPTVYVIPPVWY